MVDLKRRVHVALVTEAVATTVSRLSANSAPKGFRNLSQLRLFRLSEAAANCLTKPSCLAQHSILVQLDKRFEL